MFKPILQFCVWEFVSSMSYFTEKFIPFNFSLITRWDRKILNLVVHLESLNDNLYFAEFLFRKQNLMNYIWFLHVNALERSIYFFSLFWNNFFFRIEVI